MFDPTSETMLLCYYLIIDQCQALDIESIPDPAPTDIPGYARSSAKEELKPWCFNYMVKGSRKTFFFLSGQAIIPPPLSDRATKKITFLRFP